MRNFVSHQWSKLKKKSNRLRSPTLEAHEAGDLILERPKLREKALSIEFCAELDRRMESPAAHWTSTLLFLPLEIRKQILEDCLCGNVLYLNVSEAGGRIKQIVHMKPNEQTRNCFTLAIPLTCHQLYLETVNIIYSGNRFRLSMARTVLALPQKLLPQRINMIRDLWFQWHVSEAPLQDSLEYKEWRRVWQIIASLEGLQSLLIQIFPFFIWAEEWRAEEKWLLEDARLIARPEKFNLELAWFQGEFPIQLPCVVSRISNDD
ncbi:uncharacterized protein PAC_18836 [Phialocephala subalpina]|uniref:DUF7730 domain-containing protein n=1 Tax=Phialocephala subalpina TaxID=576137 RepID=A0A1L7XVD6_9HELO|nr:uncharacterized protein PAC_18836 [Phialocephala subalpina]